MATIFELTRDRSQHSMSIISMVYLHVSWVIFNSSTGSFVLQQTLSSSWASSFKSSFHHLSHQSFTTQNMPCLLFLSNLMASLQLLKASSCPKFIQHIFPCSSPWSSSILHYAKHLLSTFLWRSSCMKLLFSPTRCKTSSFFLCFLQRISQHLSPYPHLKTLQ